MFKDRSGELLFSVKRDGSFAGEYGLEAWIMENIDKEIPVLKDIVGNLEELEYFGNGVQYGVGGEKTDALLLHNKNAKRFKATVIELKRNNIDMATVDQVLNPKRQNYAKWIGQLVTANVNPPIETLDIQPVMIGFGIENESINRVKELEKDHGLFSKKVILNYQKRNRPNVTITVLKPILLTYKVEDEAVKYKINEYDL